jgi:hypothetical protein
VQHLFDAHLQRHVRMRADPHGTIRDIAQHGIEREPVPPILDRMDPDQHAIHRQQLIAHFLGRSLATDRRRRPDTDCTQRRENRLPSDYS